MSPAPGVSPALRVVTIIQARMNSTRLPGKILADLAGRPMLWRVVNRVRQASTVHHVVVATTTSAADDEVAAYCQAAGIDCVRGSEEDVLDRYYQAARLYQADVVVRVTADCPFIDPGVIDRIVTVFLAGDCDYATNVIRYTYPHGLDTEVFSFAALEAAWHEARQPSEREHVTPYMRNSPHRFRLRNVEHARDLSGLQLRWTVDEPADLAFARACYDRLGERQETFGFMDLVTMLEEDPALRGINQTVRGHEGYFKSLVEDEPVPPLYSLAELADRPDGPLALSQAPIWLESGAGCRVQDQAGRTYIDTGMAGGAALLGYAHPAVVQAAGAMVLADPLSHPLAAQVAEALVALAPGVEWVGLTPHGEGALNEAVRIAKRYTGRERVVCGAADLAARVKAAATAGLAAIMVEPNGDEREVGVLLREARTLADRYGAVLVVDERRTMLRQAPGGATAFFGVQADLLVAGETLANGYSLGAVMGRRDLVALLGAPEGIPVASLAAAVATLAEAQRPEVSAQIRSYGQKWRDGLNVLAREFGLGGHVRAVGLAAYSVVSFVDGLGAPDPRLAARFSWECQRRGVLFTGVQAASSAHTHADVERVLRVYRSALADLGPILSENRPR